MTEYVTNIETEREYVTETKYITETEYQTQTSEVTQLQPQYFTTTEHVVQTKIVEQPAQCDLVKSPAGELPIGEPIVEITDVKPVHEVAPAPPSEGFAYLPPQQGNAASNEGEPGAVNLFAFATDNGPNDFQDFFKPSPIPPAPSPQAPSPQAPSPQAPSPQAPLIDVRDNLVNTGNLNPSFGVPLPPPSAQVQTAGIDQQPAQVNSAPRAAQIDIIPFLGKAPIQTKQRQNRLSDSLNRLRSLFINPLGLS